MGIQLETSRLILRPWKESDLKPFYALNSNPEVMRYFPGCLTRGQSDALAHKFQKMIETQAWGLWAVELKQGGDFIGFTGLNAQPSQFSFSPVQKSLGDLSRNIGVKVLRPKRQLLV